MQLSPQEPGQPGAADLDRPDLGGPRSDVEFARLFDTYAPPLFRYLSQRAGADTAHDLVSATFLTALRQRHTYQPELGCVRPWLFGIATNLLRHHARSEVRSLRAVARSAAHARAHSADHSGRVAEQVDAAAMAAALAGALAELTESDRDVLLLTAWAGLDSSEISQVLNIPAGTVRSRLHRVRKWLRANAPKHLEG